MMTTGQNIALSTATPVAGVTLVAAISAVLILLIVPGSAGEVHW
ncbi:MAG: hypothetical protein ACWA5T_04100 [Parvularcula sp.]